MILCLGTTPAAQRVMVFHRLTLDAVNRAVTTLDGAAGKSVNVAKTLKALGEQPVAVGFLGGDRGAEVRALLAAQNIAADFVNVSARTRQCITLLDQAAGTITELVEEGQPVSTADYAALLDILRRRARGARALVMSGSITPGGPADLYFHGTQIARANGALAIVDAQGAPLAEALKAGPDLVKPNRLELAATLGRELPDEAAVIAGMRELRKRGALRVVVTSGQGPTLAYDGQNGWKIQAPQVKTTNPIGSGDAFTAGLAWRLVRGENLGEACRWGAAAGTANALTLMAGEVHRADVERLAAQVSVEPLPARSPGFF